MNMLTNADFGNRVHIKDMKESFDHFINDNNITVLNDEPTRFMSGVDHSCIDHITTDCPEKCFNTNTVKFNISEHYFLITNYKNKNVKYKPKRIKIRN